MIPIKVINVVTGATSMLDSNETQQVFGVDAQGNPLGMVTQGTPFAVTPIAPAGSNWIWSFALSEWQRFPPLAERQADASNRIDTAAGAARLRHVTDVPGQQVAYLLKAQQSRAFVALLGVGAVPPFVQAEADATGLTTLAAAQAVVAAEAVWTDQQSPAIERERRRGKINVAAASAAQLDAVTAAAIAAISVL